MAMRRTIAANGRPRPIYSQKLRPMQGIALYWPIAAAVLLVLVVAVAVGRPWLISYRKRRAARRRETVPAPA